MGTLANGTVVAPFANAAMRLLREDWKGKYGSKMLSEELYPILQTGIPQPDQNFQNFITINAGVNDTFAKLIDQFGDIQYTIDSHNGLQKVESPGYPPPKLKPRIVWAAHTIASGGSISGTELDAVAVDPETGVEIPGSYLYTPPSGTTFSTAGTSTLYVNFAPTDGVKYRRSAGSTVLTITGGGGPFTPGIVWPGSDDEVLGGRLLDGGILNAYALDPRDGETIVPGIFTYTPPAGTLLTADTSPALHVDFVPTDTVTFTNANTDTSVNVVSIGIVGRGATPAVVIDEIILLDVNVQTTTVDDSEPASTTVTVSDSLGNTYVQVGTYQSVWKLAGGPAPHQAVKGTASLWYAVVTSAGTATITVTPSSGSQTHGTSVIIRGKASGPLDNAVTNAADITSDPEAVETTTIGSSAPSGTKDLFFGAGLHVTYLTLQSVANIGLGFSVVRSVSSQNLTSSLAGALTTPTSSYAAIGASFFQKPSP